MKNVSTILSAFAFIGVLVLFGMKFSSKTTSGGASNSSNLKSNEVSLSLAYVNVDSFNAHYEYVKTKNAEFKKKQDQMEGELQRSASQFENAYREFQRKAQSGGMTQSEAENEQKRLGQMQQSLQLREQALTDQLLKEKETFNTQLQEQLDDFLKEYSKENNYDFILSYSNSLPMILYAGDNFDITQDVINGMNERAKNISDTTKKK